MGLLDGYQNISGLLNQQLSGYYDDYQDWGRQNRQQMQGTVLDPLMKMSDTVAEGLQTPGSEVMMPQVGLTLKQLQGAPKEAFRRLILGPGKSMGSRVDNFTSLKDYARNYKPWKIADNKMDVGDILGTAKKIIKSREQVGDVLRYGDEGFENLIKGSFGKPTELRTGVVDVNRKGLAGVANKDDNWIELAMGNKNINIPNTLSHEMVHVREEELIEYLRELYRKEQQLIDHVKQTNPRGPALVNHRVEYFSRPEEVMARGVANKVSDRMGLNYKDVPDSWYRHNSWPEELNPMWSEIADKLMSR